MLNMSEGRPEITATDVDRFRMEMAICEKNLSRRGWQIPDLTDAITRLDALCPYTGEMCTFKGEGWYCKSEDEADEDGRRLAEDAYGEVADWGLSDGVSFYADEDSAMVPKFFLRFVVGQSFSNPLKTVLDRRQTLVLLDPSKSFVQMDREIDSFFEPEQDPPMAEESVASLVEASEKLRALLNKPTFLRYGRKRQIQAIDKLVMNSVSTADLREREIEIQKVDEVYVVEMSPQGPLYRPARVGNTALRGRCLAVDMLGRSILPNQGLPGVRRLLGKYVGLAVAVELDENYVVDGRTLQGGTIIHLPISGQRRLQVDLEY